MLAENVPVGFTIGAQIATIACVLIVSVGGMLAKQLSSQSSRIRKMTDEQTKLLSTSLSVLGDKVDRLTIIQAVHGQRIASLEDEKKQEALAAALVTRAQRANGDHAHEGG
jgi:hypothetical protein